MFKIQNFEFDNIYLICCFEFRYSNLGFPALRAGGRGAFLTAVKSDPRGPVERWEERMQAQVAKMPVKVRHAENPRFPGQRESSLG